MGSRFRSEGVRGRRRAAVLRRQRIPVTVVAMLAAACGAPNVDVRSASAGPFVTQVVASQGAVGTGVAMTADDAGNPHLAYLQLEEKPVKGEPVIADPAGPVLP